MKASGIRAVVGRSFARIFFRNCINLGLPIITCASAVETVRSESIIRITAEDGLVEVDGEPFHVPPLPPFIIDMMRGGGLISWVKKRL
jgi:3-isopropylmalate/(R)-2-methylmalate dehydratase small subunit